MFAGPTEARRRAAERMFCTDERLRPLAYMLLALATAQTAFAGVVQTLDGRLEGNVTFADGRVEVSGKAVPWENVVYAMPQGLARTLRASGAAHLFGGDLWHGEIVRLSDNRLSLRSPFLGPREIEWQFVRAVEFQPAEPPDVRGGAATLYRDKGEPVPGNLLWIDEKRLAIDSPLGVLTLPREGAVYYDAGAAARTAPGAGNDRVGLIDGTVIRCTAKPAAGAVQVEHPVLGTVRLAAAAVRYVRREDPRVRSLGRADQAGPAGLCLEAMRLEPKRAVNCGLKQDAGKKVRLMARVGPIDGAKGDAHLRIGTGAKTAFEMDFGPGAAAVPLSLELPDADGLVLEVDLGPRLGFPCGVVLEDPLLVVLGPP
jgi:prepilin-type processing-associated H-X9-DG protein